MIFFEGYVRIGQINVQKAVFRKGNLRYWSMYFNEEYVGRIGLSERGWQVDRHYLSLFNNSFTNCSVYHHRFSKMAVYNRKCSFICPFHTILECNTSLYRCYTSVRFSYSNRLFHSSQTKGDHLAGMNFITAACIFSA